METSKPGNRPYDEVGEPPHVTTSLELKAERLLAEYLRVWGLRDPQTIAKLCRHWVRSALTGVEPPTGSLTELYRAVMQRAMSDMRRWIDHLADEVSTTSREARSRRGLLAIELQSVIDHFPAALLADGSLPAPLLEQLASAALPVVPVGCPTQMPTQSLEAVSSAKYFSRWRQAWNRFFGNGLTTGTCE